MTLWTTALKLASFVLSLLVPAWNSLEAIETPNSGDDRQWLAYWLTFTCLVVLESVFWPILRWIPLYPEAKVVVLAWLVLPRFQGALAAQETFVVPFLVTIRDQLRDIPIFQDLINKKNTSRGVGTPRPLDLSSKRTQIEEYTVQLKKMLQEKLNKIEAARSSGNVFDQRVEEKSLAKSLERLQKMVQKSGDSGPKHSSASVHMKVGVKLMEAPRNVHEYGSNAAAYEEQNLLAE